VNSVTHEDLSCWLRCSGHGIGSAFGRERITPKQQALGSGSPFVDLFSELNRFLIQEIEDRMLLPLRSQESVRKPTQML